MFSERCEQRGGKNGRARGDLQASVFNGRSSSFSQSARRMARGRKTERDSSTMTITLQNNIDWDFLLFFCSLIFFLASARKSWTALAHGYCCYCHALFLLVRRRRLLLLIFSASNQRAANKFKAVFFFFFFYVFPLSFPRFFLRFSRK